MEGELRFRGWGTVDAQSMQFAVSSHESPGQMLCGRAGEGGQAPVSTGRENDCDNRHESLDRVNEDDSGTRSRVPESPMRGWPTCSDEGRPRRGGRISVDDLAADDVAAAVVGTVAMRVGLDPLVCLAQAPAQGHQGDADEDDEPGQREDQCGDSGLRGEEEEGAEDDAE